MTDELTINVETGQLEPVGKAMPRASDTAPVRAWSKSQRPENSYDYSFPYEGGTVYGRTLGRADWGALNAILDGVRALTVQLKDTQDSINAPGGNEKLTAAEMKALYDAQMDLLARVAAGNEAYNLEVVRRAVVFWQKLPVTHGPGAIDDLPTEIIADWAAAIIAKSPPLTGEEADFLALSSNYSPLES